MKYLRLKSFKAYQKKCWKLVKGSRSGSSFSHIFIVDDLMFVVEAFEKCCLSIKEVLDNVPILAQKKKINLTNSRVFFSSEL
jgi:hypothetical protein